MLSVKRSLKRPYQQVLLVAWACILCSWLFVSLRRAAASETVSDAAHYVGSHAHRSRHFRQKPIMEDDDGSIYGEANDIDQEDPISRLYRNPLFFHDASMPDFPNVPVVVRLPTDDGSHITKQEVEHYLTSIWDLGNNRFWRTECDGQGDLHKRYEVLRDLATNHHTSEVKYFFALDLYEVKELLPRLMGSLVQAIKKLGPTKCAVSIVEGRSKDGTYAILLSLKEKLEGIGARVYLQQSDINPRAEGVDRIGALSELRNMALTPLIEQSKNATGIPTYNHETIINYINDVAICPEDIYELLFQHVFQSAHQTCAMDWVNGGTLFYDSWVSRSMSGDLFFEVPQDVSFAYADNMFWDHALTKRKFKHLQPFQVYSCWGGMITLSSDPIINGQVKFRNSTKDECYAGEPTNLAKDLWRLGYGKILTVPTVNVGYNSPEGSRIKKHRGWVHGHVKVDQTEQEWNGTELIEWQAKPPGQIKCLPGWGVGTWTEP